MSASNTGRTLIALQNAHYKYVKYIVDAMENLTDTLIFVEVNLKTTFQNYLNNLCTATLDRLAILRQSCGVSESCLFNCFNGTENLKELTEWTVLELQEYLEGRKFQYIEDVEQTIESIRESAFLSDAIYAKSTNQDDSVEYYRKTREKLGTHFKLFQESVDSIQMAMIEKSVNAYGDVADDISEWYQNVLQCVKGTMDIPDYLNVD